MRDNCPCDLDGICPYDAEYSDDCEWWCGEEEPMDDPWIDSEEDNLGLYCDE